MEAKDDPDEFDELHLALAKSVMTLRRLDTTKPSCHDDYQHRDARFHGFSEQLLGAQPVQADEERKRNEQAKRKRPEPSRNFFASPVTSKLAKLCHTIRDDRCEDLTRLRPLVMKTTSTGTRPSTACRQKTDNED